MKSKFKILISFYVAIIAIVAIFSCAKEDNGVVPYQTYQTVYTNLKDNEMVWDGVKIDIASRAGIILNHIFHPSSWTTDSYFLNIARQYRIYNHGSIDSIQYERTNISDANVGFLISNYDITIYYKNGYVELLENFICPTQYGDNFTQTVCQYPINKAQITNIHVTKFEFTGNMENDQLPYRGFQQVKLWEWQSSTEFDGIVTIRGRKTKQPETSKSLQYQPKHII